MKIVFFYAEGKERELNILNALRDGASAFGDVVEAIPTYKYHVVKDADVAAIFGVKGNSRILLREYSKLGIQTLYIDKGYTRCCPNGRKHLKFVVDGFNRDDLGMLDMPSDRFEKLGRKPEPYKFNESGPVIITGSSYKFHMFAGMETPQVYTPILIKRLNKLISNEIIYRPKPSWKEAVPLEGSRFSGPSESLESLFKEKPLAVVTYGSNAGVDAVFAGVPVISLTDLCVTYNISSTTIEMPEEGTFYDTLCFPSNKTRQKWLNDLAYQQWALDELQSGEAWGHIRKDIVV